MYSDESETANMLVNKIYDHEIFVKRNFSDYVSKDRNYVEVKRYVRKDTEK